MAIKWYNVAIDTSIFIYKESCLITETYIFSHF